MISPRAEPIHLHRRWVAEAFILAAPSRRELIERVAELREDLRGEPVLADLAHTLNCPYPAGPERLAIVASSTADLATKLDLAVERLRDAHGCRRIWRTNGLYFTENPLARAGKLAFLFPGEGSQYPNMLGDLAVHFPEVRDAFDLMDRAFAGHPRAFLPSQLIFPPGGHGTSGGSTGRLWQMDAAAESVFTASMALLALLERLGLRADAMVGHSTGEYSALLASRTIRVADGAQLSRHIRELNEVYEQFSRTGEIPRGTLLTVGGVAREVITAIVEASSGELHIAIDNCPHQLVLCGSAGSIDRAREALADTPAVCQVLPIDRAYHTPRFDDFCGPVRDFFAGLSIVPPAVEVYSCAKAARFPEAPDEIRELAVSQWARPVRFRETIEAMYAAGVRVFVEVGPRSNLTGFVTDTLRGRPVLATASNVPHRPGIEQLNHLVAMLAAHAVPMQLDRLYALRSRRTAAADDGRAAPERAERRAPRILPLNLPLLQLKEQREPEAPLATPPSGTNGGGAHSPAPAAEQSEPSPTEAVMERYLQTMHRFLAMQQEVMNAFLEGQRGDHGATVPRELPRLSAPAPARDPTGLPDPDTGPLAPALTGAVPEAEIAAPDEPPPAGERGADDLRESVLRVVAERTGYPPEMLGLTLDLEADLGVDSIKRVEIVGTLQRQLGALPPDRLEQLAGLRTLQQILDLFVGPVPAPAPFSETPASPASPLPPAREPAPSLPFVREILSLTPGVEATSLCTLRRETDPFLLDHTLGGGVSLRDPELTGLPILPLAVGLEMLAEAAAVLVPGRLVVGLRGVRAHRWILVEGESLTLQLHARRRGAHDPVEVDVRITEPDGGDGSPGGPLLEGVVLLADRPISAPRLPGQLQAERPSSWTPERLYTEGMFSGPAFRGVASVETVGDDGMIATLRATGPAFTSAPDLRGLLLDPVLLDAAGQVVGFWAAEQLAEGFVVFPLGFAELRLHHTPAPDEPVRCTALVRQLDERAIRSDLFLEAGGRAVAEIEGWEDRRFHISRDLSRFVLSSGSTELSRPWEQVEDLFPQGVTVRHLDGSAGGLTGADAVLWPRVLAHLVLGRAEREAWAMLPGPPRRRYEWLLGRVALKEAVRDRASIPRPRLADLQIGSDAHGRPVLEQGWKEADGPPPALSLTHSDGVVLAVAADPDRHPGVGVDLERAGRDPEAFASVAFSSEEWALVLQLPEALHSEWALRLWCAKESAAKALGTGLTGNLRNLTVRALDPSTGGVTLVVDPSPSNPFPLPAGAALDARTARTGDWVIAGTSIERSAAWRS